MLLFATASGGLGAELSGGNFWQGAATGLVVSGLNHWAHSIKQEEWDNGYDKNGKKINDNGGDKIDFLYDENGKIVGFRNVIKGEINFYEGGPTPSGYGYRAVSGAINEDNTLFYLYVGGKTFNIATKEFISFTGGLKQWVRIGPSYSIEGSFKTFSVRWGAGGNFWKNIGSEYLQALNKSFRQMKIPFNSWRTVDPGHFHLWKL